MRIVGGDWRGRSLLAPQGRDTRPTSDRTRESVFNTLIHSITGELDGLRVLDAFAGTGALGLEALSRGAAQATFIERQREALAVLRQNITALGAHAQAVVIATDATRPPVASAAVDLVFLDPPYQAGLLPTSLQALVDSGWIGPHTVAVCEQEATSDLDAPAFELIDQRRYGKAKISFLRLRPPTA